MNIFESFELFWSLPKKLFGKKFFRVMHIETSDNFAQSLETQVANDGVHLNVYNNPRMYSLLTSVLHKKKLLNENKNGKIYQECTLL